MIPPSTVLLRCLFEGFAPLKELQRLSEANLGRMHSFEARCGGSCLVSLTSCSEQRLLYAQMHVGVYTHSVAAKKKQYTSKDCHRLSICQNPCDQTVCARSVSNFGFCTPTVICLNLPSILHLPRTDRRQAQPGMGKSLLDRLEGWTVTTACS